MDSSVSGHTKMKIYIAGPITNSDPIQQKLNILRFYEKEVELTRLGHEVYNPVKGEDPGESWETYLAQDIIRGIIEFGADKIYFMKGWETSKGALLEKAVGLELKLELQYEV